MSAKIKGTHLDLSQYHGKTLAIVVRQSGGNRIIRGTARYEFDEIVGNFLRIKLGAEDETASDQESPNFIFYEEGSDFEILPDTEFGCDFCVSLDPLNLDQHLRRPPAPDEPE